MTLTALFAALLAACGASGPSRPDAAAPVEVQPADAVASEPAESGRRARRRARADEAAADETAIAQAGTEEPPESPRAQTRP